MIAALITMQVLQAQPMMRTSPALVKPNVTATASLSEAPRNIAQAGELLARAELVRADYVRAGGPALAELNLLINQLKNDLDSMSERGELQSLRLQMVMDRISKFMSTLSNSLKKISDTQNSIVQNVK